MGCDGAVLWWLLWWCGAVAAVMGSGGVVVVPSWAVLAVVAVVAVPAWAVVGVVGAVGPGYLDIPAPSRIAHHLPSGISHYATLHSQQQACKKEAHQTRSSRCVFILESTLR